MRRFHSCPGGGALLPLDGAQRWIWPPGPPTPWPQAKTGMQVCPSSFPSVSLSLLSLSSLPLLTPFLSPSPFTSSYHSSAEKKHTVILASVQSFKGQILLSVSHSMRLYRLLDLWGGVKGRQVSPGRSTDTGLEKAHSPAEGEEPLWSSHSIEGALCDPQIL